MSTFKNLCKAADELGSSYGSLGYSVNALLSSAETNASDTVYVENAAPEAEFDVIALYSLESLLAFSDDKAACDWFASQGVQW